MNRKTPFPSPLRNLVLVALVGAASSLPAAGAVEALLQQYRHQGASSFDAGRGRELWSSTHRDARSGQERSCTSCHTRDLRQPGKHARTGKRIEPMAPSVNPKRFSDTRKVEKWFKRNCKWTLGRECTPQEKGDLLTWLSSQ